VAEKLGRDVWLLWNGPPNNEGVCHDRRRSWFLLMRSPVKQWRFATVTSLFFGPLGYACCLCEATLGPTVDALNKFKAAYCSPISYSVYFRNAATFDSSVSAAELSQLIKIPGVERVSFMGQTAPFYTLEAGELHSDGGELLRMAVRQLTVGGLPANATRIELWNSTEYVTASRIGADRAELRHLQRITIEERARAHTDELLTYEQYRVECGYLPMAQYAVEVLGQVSDLSLGSADDDTYSLKSSALGLEVQIDAKSGELLRYTQHEIDGTWTDYKYTGWLAGQWFPSRHPSLLQRTYHSKGGSEIAPNQSATSSFVIYDSIRLTGAPQPIDCNWSSIANRALDLKAKHIIRPDRSVDEALTEHYKLTRKRPPTNTLATDSGKLDLNTPVFGMGRVALAVGLITLCCGGVLWARRRLS